MLGPAPRLAISDLRVIAVTRFASLCPPAETFVQRNAPGAVPTDWMGLGVGMYPGGPGYTGDLWKKFDTWLEAQAAGVCSWWYSWVLSGKSATQYWQDVTSRTPRWGRR